MMSQIAEIQMIAIATKTIAMNLISQIAGELIAGWSCHSTLVLAVAQVLVEVWVSRAVRGTTDSKATTR